MTRKNITSLVIVVLIGLLLEVGLIALDHSNTPSDAAVSFAKDYYELSPAMTDWLCDASSVDNYIYTSDTNAAERGYSSKCARYALSHIETKTEYLDHSDAVVHLTAHRRLDINPLYVYVAGIFKLGKTYDVDASFQLQYKDGRWRICKTSLPLQKKG